MCYYAEKNPQWIEWIVPERFNDKDLFRIVTFFVFHSPCEGKSAMGRSLVDYKWSSPWKKPYKLNIQLKKATSNPNLLFSAPNYSHMKDALEKANLADGFPKDLSTERICILDNKKNQFLSVFGHIRNAFAHGRLNMVDYEGDCIFILEDIAHKNKVSARMILRKSSLLNWIDIIEGGERAYNQEKAT